MFRSAAYAMVPSAPLQYRLPAHPRCLVDSETPVCFTYALLPDSAWYKLGKFIAWKRAQGESLEPTAPLFVSRRGLRIATRTLRHLFRLWQERAGFDRLLPGPRVRGGLTEDEQPVDLVPLSTSDIRFITWSHQAL